MTSVLRVGAGARMAGATRSTETSEAERWERRPDLFIVGAPKCGTTALYAYLGQHPEIFMSPLKEPHFFGSDLPFGDRAPLTQFEYRACFAGARNEKRIGEASVWYLYSRRAAVEIKEFNPSAHVIVMLRNPVDMMYALYGERRFQGSEDLDSFEAALRAEPLRQRGLNRPRRGMLDGGFYRAIASYPEQVARFFDVFGRQNVHVIIFDDLQTDTAAIYGSVIEFLGVSADFTADLRIENASRRAHSDRVARFLHDPPRVLLRLGRAVLSRSRRARAMAWIRALNARPAARPAMDPELRRRLQAELAPEVERLSGLLARDLTPWCRP